MKRDNEFLDLLIKASTVKKAVKSMLALIEGRHPADPEQTVDAKLVLAASQAVLDRAIPVNSKTGGCKVEYRHVFTEVPIDEARVKKEED